MSDRNPTTGDPDQRFWEMSFDMQIRLGKSEAEAKAHADDYVAKLKAADAANPNFPFESRRDGKSA